MSPTKPMFALIALACSAAGNQLRAQDVDDASSGLLAPDFVEIEYAGPVSSQELERLVTTYAANGRHAEAVDAFADYLMRTDKEQDPDCEYCIALLRTEGTHSPSEQLQLLTQAMDEVVDRSYRSSSGDNLMRLALMAKQSGNRAALNRGVFHLSVAIQTGMDSRWTLEIIDFLNVLGRHEDARKLATSLHEDPSSAYYLSPVMEQWIAYLGSEIRRYDAIGQRLTSFTPGSTQTDQDYVPLSKPSPKYPGEAASAGLEGDVILQYTITPGGRPSAVEVVRSSNAVFENAAVAATEQFLYLPRVLAGNAVEVPGVRVKIKFANPR